MSDTQADVLCDLPEDVVAQLLSNIENAANQHHSTAHVGRGQRHSVRNSQDTAVIARDSSSSNPAAEVEDSSSSSEEEEGGGTDEDESWPVATWQHQVSLPKTSTAGNMNQLSLGKAALASEKAFSSKARVPLQDARKAEKASRKVKEDTAGKDWFDMKAKPITESVKRDWRLLRLRATYDPKRFYKSFDSGRLPKYFQMGTIVEGMGEYFSARMTKKERKQTLTEELLADIQLSQQRKRRFEALQAERQELAKQRKKIRALHKRSKHRPKH